MFIAADEINMIGAMPAVAVRHERRRQEKRNKRPSLLYLQSTQSRSTSPSPVQSSPGLYSAPQLEIYILGKVSFRCAFCLKKIHIPTYRIVRI